jgi:hypothetical protein
MTYATTTTLKPDTAKGVRVLNRQQRDALRRTQAFRDRNALWTYAALPGTKNHKFGAWARVGQVAKIISDACPETYDDFANYYLENVHSWETIQDQADEWYRFVVSKGLEITPEEALAEHIIHVIDQTWDGWADELKVAEVISKKMGYEIGRPDFEWDGDYAIDLIRVEADAPDGFIEGFQVKPRGFFTSTRDAVIRARRENSEKHALAEAKGKKILFAESDAARRGELVLIHWKDLK